ncbi:hypothetical protein J8I29_18610 [Labrys sp. LIt4]|uniref:hypothetical protein n=1 Tax=Labrys sp. LIt4 TaxID=2821355 RepID=UPI001ADEF69B|nr:hypothetical protein [Labrys sp. LIt4]MBP0581348.1 hypothetical protein [Labrys sp. LIt4]
MTAPASILHELPGGEELLAWFGRVPRFHDGHLLEIAFFGKGQGLMRIHAWILTDKADDDGHLLTEKHAVVTFALEGVSTIECSDFDMVPGIIFELDVTRVEQGLRFEWSASYGVNGTVTARQARITLEPGKP